MSAKLKIQYSYLLIIHGSHVFPGSRWNQIFMWRTWHTLVALNSKRFTLDMYLRGEDFQPRIAHGGHVFAGMWHNFDFFTWPHRSFCRKIGSNRSFAHSRFDSKVIPYKWFFSKEPNFTIFFQLVEFFLVVLNFHDPEF
jgi:hypothetical protein